MAVRCSARWHLRLGRPFPSAQVGYAVPAELRDGTPAVLKVNPKGERECAREAEALAVYDGRGAVRLLEHDPEENAFLVERCEPGTPLIGLPEEEANPLAARVCASLMRPLAAGHPFDTLAAEAVRWAEELEAAEEAGIVAHAAALLRELGRTQGEQVLLNQDLHQENILASRREPWLAIDPKPIVGDRDFAPVPLIRDRKASFEPALVLRRLDFYSAELGLDRERVRGWTLGHTVAWSSGDETMLAIARALAQEGQ